MPNTAEPTVHRPPSRRGKLVAVAAAVVGVAVVGGCGGSDGAVSAGGAVVQSAWARSTASGQTTGAIYFDVTVDTDDVLLDATVAASVAADAQLHGVVIADATSGTGHDTGDTDMDDMDDMDDMSGGSGDAVTMQAMAAGVDVTGDRTVSFEPGGHHVMLVDLVEPLVVGDTISLVLEFRDAPDVTIDVDVRESAP